MPTYEYKCDTCGNVFEVWQRITDEPLTRCTRAGCIGNISRIINGAGGFILKGSGFYSTDYRSADYKKRSENEASSLKKTENEKTKKPSSDKK